MSHRLDSYQFELPEELVAQSPAKPRDSSRLLVLDRRTGQIEDATFSDLTGFLQVGDLLVANNSRVIAARLLGHRMLEGGLRGGKVEFLLLREVEPKVWEGMFHAAARHRSGVTFEVVSEDGQVLKGSLVRGSNESTGGTVIARFDRDPREANWGQVPLPPYIRRRMAPRPADGTDYQTVYARRPGSAAAPTAGLHFTRDLLDDLSKKGVRWQELVLHVGLGTFRPVKAKDVRDHVMHREYYDIPLELSESLKRARRVVAVGTTSVRALESSGGRAGPGNTDVFFYPDGPSSIERVDGLITNFHLPGSTLLMLVCHFAGRENVLRAYHHAIEKRYRFYSYGDAMLII